MTSNRIKLILYIFPALVIGGFETLRHTISIPYISSDLGNWVTALLTSLIVALFSKRMFTQFEMTERELSLEREKRAVFEERERLARELHDQIAQTIFYLGVQVESIQNRMLRETDGLQVTLDEIQVALREMDDNYCCIFT